VTLLYCRATARTPLSAGLPPIDTSGASLPRAPRRERTCGRSHVRVDQPAPRPGMGACASRVRSCSFPLVPVRGACLAARPGAAQAQCSHEWQPVVDSRAARTSPEHPSAVTGLHMWSCLHHLTGGPGARPAGCVPGRCASRSCRSAARRPVAAGHPDCGRVKVCLPCSAGGRGRRPAARRRWNPGPRGGGRGGLHARAGGPHRGCRKGCGRRRPGRRAGRAGCCGAGGPGWGAGRLERAALGG